MLVVTLLDRIHDKASCFGHTAKEDEGLGAGEGCKVGTSFTEHVAGELIDALGQGVSLAGCNRDIK